MRTLIFLLLLCGSVQAANLDSKLMVISDLHHSQVLQSVTNSLLPMIELVGLKDPLARNYLGLGDIIDRNDGVHGPFSANIGDLVAAFYANNITFKSAYGNHDPENINDTSGLYPGKNWAWDVGTKWRVLALESSSLPGYSVSSDEMNWLTAQLDSASSDGMYCIVVLHYELHADIPTPTQILTASGTTGTVTVTSNSAGTFNPSLTIGQNLYLKHGTCTDDSCWGEIYVTQCDGGSSCTTGTAITGTVRDDLASSGPANFWGFLQQYEMASNSGSVRSLLEQYPQVVKLVLNGHTHLPDSSTINGINYRTIQSSRPQAPGKPKTGGMLYLYDDGGWKIRGYGEQVSYNWDDFYVDAINGSDTDNGGTSQYDPYLTLSKACAAINAGGRLTIMSNVSGTINLNGNAENLIEIYGDYKITGNIQGSYIDIRGVSITAGAILAMSNSKLSGVKSRS